ncbi:MAG: hypothetical protein JWR72_628 [Flavisolibacter sp.]|nr:hypothetical protein [Flavisolibacter sp.]
MATQKLSAIIFSIAFIFLLLVQGLPAYSQVVGCRDPAAINYNSSATISDSSCMYNATSYTPPVKVNPISNVLIETSGLQWAGSFLWSFNDGGGAAAIYRIDTASDAILQTVNLGGVTNIDWEDIAFDGTHFYIGDFGNNADGARTDLTIYKFPLSAIPDYITDPVATISSTQIEVINFTYSDQVPVVATTVANTTRFDCEAMIVDGGKIHLFSKNWVDVNTTHYIINGTTAGNYVATPVETFATNYLVTAADKVPGLNIIALLGYRNEFPGNHFMHLLTDFSTGLYFNGNRRRIDLPDAATMGQAEGITFRNSTYGYISNEKVVNFITIDQKLHSFNTESFAPLYVLPLDLTNFSVRNVAGLHQVNWRFALPVQNLKVLGSSNQTDFKELKTYNTSTTGTFFNQPSASLSCYKLCWQQGNGGLQYSATICLNTQLKNGLSNIVLHANGELNFILTGNSAINYVFRLITTDGKLIAQTKRLATPGLNLLRFPQNISSHHFVLLQAIGGKEQKGVMLSVKK